jgi:methylenetetrahydrofolate reductase (NADPH)
MSGPAPRASGDGLSVSFEFFPPKTSAQAETLFETAGRLSRLSPDFVSVTYGAGGTSRDRSLDAVRRLHQEQRLDVAAHLTCVGASRDDLAATIADFRDAGIERFVALRGDPPGGLGLPYAPHSDGYKDTGDLVRALKKAGARDVSVAAYPERHPQSPDWATEIDTLKRKVDGGADRAITQFFFDTDLFEAYVERVRRAGIGIPVVPGIMPIGRFAAIRDFAGRCGTSVPESLRRRFDGLEEESEASRAVAVAVCVEQVDALRATGVTAFHFYTLNRADLCEAILTACGIARGQSRAAA